MKQKIVEHPYEIKSIYESGSKENQWGGGVVVVVVVESKRVKNKFYIEATHCRQ